MDPEFWTAGFAALATLGVAFLNYKANKLAKEVKEVHDFVNHKDAVNTQTIDDLRSELDALRKEILRRADASPAHGPMSVVPQPVTIEGQKEVLDVAVKKTEK